MVVFTCNNCGESLQKPKVEKHYFRCRKPKSLTCVDCHKDFRADEYTAHTKCITEEERYSAKGTFTGGNIKKGEAKQESWVDTVKSIVEREKNLRPPVRNLLNDISHFCNIPQRRAKFINFIQNSRAGRANNNDIEEVWNIIEKYKSEQKQNGATCNKRKIEDNHNNNDNNKDVSVEKKPKLENKNDDVDEFSFSEKIVKIVTKKGTISKEKLRQKVLKAYGKATGIEDVPKETIKKYKKALRKLPEIVIIDDEVSLK